MLPINLRVTEQLYRRSTQRVDYSVPILYTIYSMISLHFDDIFSTKHRITNMQHNSYSHYILSNEKIILEKVVFEVLLRIFFLLHQINPRRILDQHTHTHTHIYIYI